MSEESEVQSQPQTLFDRLGGEAAVSAAVDLFYDKVLSDYRINRYFEKSDMSKQKAHLKAFLTFAFGGPNNYSGRSLGDAHARLVKMGLNDFHYDAVMEHFGATMTELGVPGELIAEAAGIAESVRGEVLGK